MPLGSAFAPTREFEFSGGLTGVAGSDRIYASGAAHFDSFQPDMVQEGLLVLNGSGLAPLGEIARLLVPGDIDVGPAGSARANPTMALGSIERDLALVTGVAGGGNTVSLLTPTFATTSATTTTTTSTGSSSGTSTVTTPYLTPDGTVTLADPNRLAGLSESFHPELVGSVLVDIRGDLGTFAADTSRGLVLNDSGSLGLLHIGNATDTTVVARPFLHASIKHRNNVLILSTTRAVDGRNGVTVDPTLRPIGPLTLP